MWDRLKSRFSGSPAKSRFADVPRTSNPRTPVGVGTGTAEIANQASRGMPDAQAAIKNVQDYTSKNPGGAKIAMAKAADAPASSAQPAKPAGAAASKASAPAKTTDTSKPAAPVKASTPLTGKSLQSRISDLAKSNKIANPDKIYAGKTMNVDGQKYTIQKGDTLTGIAKKFSNSSSQPAAKADTTTTAKVSVDNERIRKLGYLGDTSGSVKSSGTMKAADTSADSVKQAITAPPSTGTSGMSTMSKIPGSTTEPRRATSDTGGFMAGNKVDPQNSIGSKPSAVAPGIPDVPKPMMTNFQPAAPMGNIPKMSDQPANMSATTKKPGLRESVQVGDNKYRIV
jgi:hypothetical protein